MQNIAAGKRREFGQSLLLDFSHLFERICYRRAA